MRLAELIMAVVMGLFSTYLMVKSAELPIGYIPDEGPGGGAFPFWLSLGMLICCVWVGVNWWRRSSPPARSDQPFMDRQTVGMFLISAGSLTVMIAAIHIIGVYGAIPLFLIFYLRFVGQHSWRLTGVIAAVSPIATFFFFEIMLHITLPKGYTEPLFYPLYDLFL